MLFRSLQLSNELQKEIENAIKKCEASGCDTKVFVKKCGASDCDNCDTKVVENSKCYLHRHAKPELQERNYKLSSENPSDMKADDWGGACRTRDVNGKPCPNKAMAGYLYCHTHEAHLQALPAPPQVCQCNCYQRSLKVV